MADHAYPLLVRTRRRRHRRWRLTLPTIGRRGGALIVMGVAAIVLLAILFGPRPPRSPSRAFADAVAAIDRGNYSAARNDAMAAVAGDPTSPAAHMMLARTYLLLGDGLAADAELDRAVTAAVDAARISGPRARAKLLQGDFDDAAALARDAPATDTLAARTLARTLAVAGDRAGAEAVIGGVQSRNPRDADALVDLGQLRLEAGDIGAASEAVARAARLAPRDPAALTLQGEVVRRRYGLVAALPWFDAALKHDAYFPSALIDRAAVLGDLGRYNAMLATTRKALAARPNDPRALYLQATLAARAGRQTLARTLLQRAGPIDLRVPGAMLVSGAIDYRDGRYEQAIDDWRRLTDAQPMNLVARRLLAAALLRSGDAQGALNTLAPMLARADADTYTLTLAARAAERIGDRATAGTYLDRAGRGPSGGAGIFATNASLASFAEDAALAPEDATVQVALIRARLDNGDPDAAIALAAALAQRYPGDPAMQRALGDTLAVTNHAAEAANAYARAADLSFDEPTMLRLVDMLGRTGQPQQASAALSLYLQQNPQSITAQRLRAHWLVAIGQGADAVAELEALRRVVGNRDSALLVDLTLAHLAIGEPARASHYARAAYRLSPLDPAVVDAYGQALAAARDRAGARQLFAKALALDPGNILIEAHARRVAG